MNLSLADLGFFWVIAPIVVLFIIMLNTVLTNLYTRDCGFFWFIIGSVIWFGIGFTMMVLGYQRA